MPCQNQVCHVLLPKRLCFDLHLFWVNFSKICTVPSSRIYNRSGHIYHFLVYITGVVTLYIYHFLVYITGVVIYTIFWYTHARKITVIAISYAPVQGGMHEGRGQMRFSHIYIYISLSKLQERHYFSTGYCSQRNEGRYFLISSLLYRYFLGGGSLFSKGRQGNSLNGLNQCFYSLILHAFSDQR